MNIIQMSLNASVLLIIVMIVRRLFMNRLPKVTFLLLWGLVALKLVIPFSFSSHLDIQSLLNHVLSANKYPEPSVFIENTTLSTDIANSFSNSFFLTIDSNLLLLMWLFGVFVILFFFGLAYVRFHKEFQTAIPIKDHPLISAWLLQQPLKRTIKIALSDRIAAPLTYKLFKPVILFPKSMDWSNESNVQFVLAHEFIHIKRWDLCWKMMMTIIVALHWFNPLVWVMYFLFNRDLELTCDEKVIKKLGTEAKSAYALSLINMAEKSQMINPACSRFSGNGMEERIVSIMKFKNPSILGVALAGALVIGGITVFAATGQASETPKENNDKLIEATNQNETKNNKNNNATNESINIKLVETPERNFEVSENGNEIIIKDAVDNTQETINEDITKLIPVSESK